MPALFSMKAKWEREFRSLAQNEVDRNLTGHKKKMLVLSVVATTTIRHLKMLLRLTATINICSQCNLDYLSLFLLLYIPSTPQALQ